jgi:hypothetical protein
MRSFASLVIVLGLFPALVGCTDEGVSDPRVTQDPALSVASRGTPRQPPARLANPSQTFLHPRPPAGKPNVDRTIPSEQVADSIVPRGPSVSSPGTEAPQLPSGPGAQRPTPANPVVACRAAPALKLACPDDAPTASTCTSVDHLPVGCHAMTAPGALYPPNAIPACCS